MVKTWPRFRAWGRYHPHNRNDLDRAGFAAKLKELALAQVTRVVAKTVYASRQPPSAGLLTKDTYTTYGEVADLLAGRIQELTDSVRTFDPERWVAEFEIACSAEEERIKPEWEAHWHKIADGKKIIEEIHHWMEPGMPVMEFKRIIVRAMAHYRTDAWKIVDSILSNALK